MKLSFYIAKRYLFARKSRNAINVISAVSVAGVAVGTMALIIILSVFNGLEDMINKIFNTFDPDLCITAAHGKVFTPDSISLARLSEIKGIYAFSATLEDNAALRYGDRQYIASIKGVDDNYINVSGIDSSMVDGEFILKTKTGEPRAVLGYGVARYLAANINFVTPLSIWVPRRTGGNNINPENTLIHRYLFPSGIFEIEQEYDSKYLFLPIDFCRELLEYQNEVSAIEIKLKDYRDEPSVRKEVGKIFGKDFIIKNRVQQQEIFYKVMHSERLAIFFILTLIIVIASFNIIGSLTMLIIEKERDIEILKSLGADNNLIRKIFIFEGWLISILGAMAGLLSGFIICWIQYRFGLIKLNSEVLIMRAYPVILKLRDFIIVPATVLTIGYWAAWYPVRFLTKKYLLKNEKKSSANKNMKNFNTSIILLLVSVILFSSCKSRDENKKLVPEKDLVNVLTELYIGDGLLVFPNVRTRFSDKDSVLNQIDILKKHGLTKKRMDNTMRYYFEKNPKKLENIYDQILTRLNEKQALVEKELTFRNQFPSNLWKKDIFINLPESGPENPVWFKIPAKDTGNYILEFESTVFRNDRSLNPRVTVFFWHTDSSKTEDRINWDEVKLPKDGRSHNYSISKRKTDTTYTYIGGWLLNSDPKRGHWQKHAKIENILLRKADAK